ncbi:MAG TPA: ribonuclease R [Candidatus Desulfofervidus auxilii]|uniref:Ribonuclease R n=1 Tax=Desulfofervidus auxilii TaxID=1621989 RepID=A0A7V1N2D8_DESA2|nr:ribonuclease R [Candidatus Desulfofervidus auxilii]
MPKKKSSITPKKIIKYMSQVDKPVTIREICRHLGLKERKKVQEILTDLEKQGKIIQISSQRYGLLHKMNLVVGHLSYHPDGYGFVIPEKEKKGDIFIKPRHLKKAMHGDRVIVRLDKRRRGRLAEGEIVRILERKNKYIVGIFETDGQVGFLIPEEQRFATEIVIPLSWAKKAGSGQMVVAEIVRFPNLHRGALAKIVEVLGDASLLSTQTQIVTYKYNLPQIFPEPALKEAEEAASQAVSLNSRTDLRRLTFFTIDGEKAKDFDDAVGIKKEKSGYRLYVSIADVAHYVPPHSVLDREAFLRGNSVYFPEQVLPMLPFSLSQGICSLNPKQDRLTITVEMRFTQHGEMVNYNIYQSVIQSKARLTYSQVQSVLDNRGSGIRSKRIIGALQLMAELAEILRQRRMKRGSLDFDLPEPKVILDLLGHTTDIIRAERLFSHKIIEEFMIATNETVAMHLTEQGWPMVYRVHDKPTEEKVVAFTKLIETLGYNFPLKKEYTPIDFQRLLEEVKGSPHEFLVNRLLLRSLKQARYSSYNTGHFGLASDCYTHFTSPIRRYADLVVHRILKKQLHYKRPQAKLIKNLEGICEHISEKERIAMEAEREIIDRLRVQFMTNKIGEEYDGVISGVTGFGFFVELNSVFVEGLVRLSSLHDDYYFFDQRNFTLIGKRTRKSFRLGDKVRVRVIDVKPHRREIELHLLKKYQIFSNL